MLKPIIELQKDLELLSAAIEKTRKRADRILSESLRQGAALQFAGRMELDYPKLSEWWTSLKDLDGEILATIQGYESGFRSSPKAWADADSFSIYKELQRLLFADLSSTTQALHRLETEHEELDRLIYDRQVKEGGLAKADRAFRFAKIVLIVSILLSIATKVFEPTLVGLQHLIYGLPSQQTTKAP
jgi:hypothetical protein